MIVNGISEKVIKEISKDKKEPAWMLDRRLKSFSLFKETPNPKWGPSLSRLDLNEIIYYIKSGTKQSETWDDIPEYIKNTFDKLGIPEAEKKFLAGVGAQFDSEVVYHNLKKDLEEQGVIFENMDTAVHTHPELVEKYFMTSCIPPSMHKFTMLHAAVWSGGTFIYVPKGVKVDLPIQAYFRMNAQGAGQFEHTLIIADEFSELEYIEGCSAPRYTKNSLHAGAVEIFVHNDAKVKYYSIENWSKNVYNLNTKRALVDKNGTIEWLSGNMGSNTTMLYPCSVLRGENATSSAFGVTFAGKGQNQDIGSKVIHLAPNTKSVVRSKSISADGGITTYRGLVKIGNKASGSQVSVECDALLVDSESRSDTIPHMNIQTDDVNISHEARTGKIGDEELFFLQSRGLGLSEAVQMIVTGFVKPIINTLPLEYAVELERLVIMEIENSVA